MKPSEVLTREKQGTNFSGMFGCHEIEMAAYYVVSYLFLKTDSWDVDFTLRTIRERFPGSDEAWSMLVCHRHSPVETKNCMLVDWLSAQPKGKFSVTSEFVLRASRGSAIAINVVDAARVRFYCKAARQTSGLHLENVRLVHNPVDEVYEALVKGDRVVLSGRMFEEMVTEFYVELEEDCCNEQSYTLEGWGTPFNNVTMSRWFIEDADTGDYRAELLAELLMAEWQFNQ